MPFFIPLICLMAIGVALFRRSFRAAPSGQEAPDDLPLQLLRWATGLLSAQREEWGRAMLGELGHVDGRVRRWRFAVGCTGAALLLPPWGRAVAVAWAMGVIAAGAVGMYAFVGARYGLQADDWVYAAAAVVLLVRAPSADAVEGAVRTQTAQTAPPARPAAPRAPGWGARGSVWGGFVIFLDKHMPVRACLVGDLGFRSAGGAPAASDSGPRARR